MKFQYLAVIFVIIMLPIILVMSFYVQTQMDVMKTQGEYRTYLTDATFDAVKAFQINTTNSYFSSVSDSKIRDIEAAVNAFYNSLTANLNYNKSELQPYVPAVVFTLYDGYYIYGKRYNVYTKDKVKIDQKTGDLLEMEIKQGDDIEKPGDSEFYEYGLKPFVYYSCQYKKGNDYDFVVNYTLDNFISIYGYIKCYNEETKMVDTHYVSKSGYLINVKDSKSEFKDTNGDYKETTIDNDIEQLTEYLKFSSPSDDLPDRAYNYVVHQNQKIYIKKYDPADPMNDEYFWYDQGVGHDIQGITTKAEIRETIERNNNEYKNSSYEYYSEAYKFSKWVDENLGNIVQDDIYTVVRQNNGTIEVKRGGENLSFNAGDKPIFKITGTDGMDPENPSSTFNQHRMAVIKNAIETNLIAAINSYNSNASSFAYAMPRLAEEDWEKVVNNVCMISFMQGMPIGTKYFNDYVVIPNDKNNEFVDTDALYLLTDNGSEHLYHLANCPLLVESTEEFQKNNIVGGYINTSFQRQTVEKTYEDDRKENQYYYRHVYDNGGKYTAYTPCYQCLVGSSGKYDLDDVINNTTGHNISILRKKYFTYLGREKNNLYKTSQ